MLRLRPRYLGRYRRIAEVLVRHGFGAIVAQLGLDQALDLRRRLAPPPEQPVTRKTAAVHLREAIEELGPTFIKFGQIDTTRRVEVQERIYGIKINDYPALAAAGYDRDRIAMNAAKGIIKEVLADGFFHCRPASGQPADPAR